jgi:hypothetical protein
MYKFTFKMENRKKMEKEIEALMLQFGAENVYECLITKLEAHYNLYKKISRKDGTNQSNDSNQSNEVINTSITNDTSIEDKEDSKKEKETTKYKQKQRAEQKLKYEENMAKGIEPKSLLTKENLQDWLCEKGYTFAHIAAKIVGCKEEEVSTLAAAYQLERKNKNMAQKILIWKKTRGG